jgi:hypothetical protein
LVLATHGRGIWIVDDISPLRKLTSEVLNRDVAFLEGRPTQQRFSASGGWAEGDAMFGGANPPNAALITYYQKKRHIFGRMKIEVYDPQGKLVDTLPGNSRRGISRVRWSMRIKAPKVPPAATVAFEASSGPRVLPGTYTVKMTRGSEIYVTQFNIGLDARATYTPEDRKLQFDTSMRIYNLLGDMSFDVERINSVRDSFADRAGKLGAGDSLRPKVQQLSQQVDEIRRKIVATKEGGAITGEERIREKTAELYGRVTNYEGRPADYQVARVDSLTHELNDVVQEFEAFAAKQLPQINQALTAKKLQPIKPLSREDWDKANRDSGAGSAGSMVRDQGERDLN